MMPIEQKDFECLVICAFKYALGRRTYIAYEICDLIQSYKKDLPEWMLVKIQAEIALEIDRNEAGMLMDEQNWMELSRDISYYLKNKEV